LQGIIEIVTDRSSDNPGITSGYITSGLFSTIVAFHPRIIMQARLYGIVSNSVSVPSMHSVVVSHTRAIFGMWYMRRTPRNEICVVTKYQDKSNGKFWAEDMTCGRVLSVR